MHLYFGALLQCWWSWDFAYYQVQTGIKATTPHPFGSKCASLKIPSVIFILCRFMGKIPMYSLPFMALIVLLNQPPPLLGANCGRLLVTTCYHSSAFQPPTATRLHSSTPQGKCWASLADVTAQTQKHSPSSRLPALLLNPPSTPSLTFLSFPCSSHYGFPSSTSSSLLLFMCATVFLFLFHLPVNISVGSPASLILSHLCCVTE